METAPKLLTTYKSPISYEFGRKDCHGNCGVAIDVTHERKPTAGDHGQKSDPRCDYLTTMELR